VNEDSAIRYVAIGDSFDRGCRRRPYRTGACAGGRTSWPTASPTRPGGRSTTRTWRVRGRLLGRIIDEQLDAALALGPTLVSVNGGGNDMLRPGTNLPWIIAETERALRRIRDAGAEPLLVAGANPTIGIPRGAQVRVKGDRLAAAAAELAERLGITYCDNWSDPVLARREYWSPDRLHLAPVGHARVATNVLRALGHPHPADWAIDAEPMPAPTRREDLRYAREHVVPWLARRITGRSSGDGRTAKVPGWVEIVPRG